MLDSLEQKRLLALDPHPNRSHFADRGIVIRFCRNAAEASEIASTWKPAALCIRIDRSEQAGADMLRACRCVSALHDVPAIAVVSDGDFRWRPLMEAGYISFIRGPIEDPANRNIIAAIGGSPILPSDREILTFQDLRMDLDEHKVWRGPHRLDVPSLQFELLKLLMQNPGRIFTKEELMDRIWKDKAIDIHTVNTCCMRLRHTLSSKGGSNLLQNIRGHGYALDTE